MLEGVCRQWKIDGVGWMVLRARLPCASASTAACPKSYSR